MRSCDVGPATCWLARALHCQFPLGGLLLLGLRQLRHCRLGEQEHAGDRDGVFEREAHHLGGVDDAGLDQIDVLLARGSKP